MELPKTDNGNHYVLVIVEEVIPFFGVPEALRGTNLVSHLMRDICDLLGIHKLNTTAYHPRDGIERYQKT